MGPERISKTERAILAQLIPVNHDAAHFMWGALGQTHSKVMALMEEQRIRGLFPKAWYTEFLRSLKSNPTAKRLVKGILPRCDCVRMGVLAMQYVLSPEELGEARRLRAKLVASELRKRARKLDGEISSHSIVDAGKLSELESIRKYLKRAPAENDKRAGVAAYHGLLFVIREYLHFRSGLRPQPKELAAIVKAARAALKRRTEYQLVDPHNLSKSLRLFEKNSPEFCLLARGFGSVRVIENLK
jgi:hypothetical protein